MRRILTIMVALGLLVPSGAIADDTIPYLPRPCTSESPVDVPRPDTCKRVLYSYGPIVIPPGDNLIVAEPVTIEKPVDASYIVRFKPDLHRPDGTVPNIEELHLHHAVWLVPTRFGTAPPFAAGEEKTIFSLPNGYGVTVFPQDVWVLNYMVHNQTAEPEVVFITYELDLIPWGTPGMRAVEPQWLDVGRHNGLNPVYNNQRAFGGGDGECSFPKEQCAHFDPYGRAIEGQGTPGNGVGQVTEAKPGTVVWMGGHLHPGGLRNDVDLIRNGKRTRVFTSDAKYFDPNGPVSWDMAMEVTRPSYRLQVKPGDRYVLNAVYETQKASWYEPMGIVVIFVDPNGGSGPDPFKPGFDPNNATITHGHLAEADVHGSDGETPLGSGFPRLGAEVAISAFAYIPGNLGTEQFGVPSVEAGEGIGWTNYDAAAMIYHTITACKVPCNGATGISYPLANGPEDFDSLQLGFGPPSATAAANKVRFTLDTSGFDPGYYTYFCRVHPGMRGLFEVT